jgi:hypothetical protein|tara:strand:- start:482 stop:643 length:162 start_codon:yes stop_codon:yes gene_type:complete
MAINKMILNINWIFRHTWKIVSINILWPLLGCSIGDIRTNACFQFVELIGQPG